VKGYSFHPEAMAEADAAAAFYEERQEGLGARFVAALEDTVDRICRSPGIFRQVEPGVRKCRLLRYPYGVVFREREGAIEIIAVMHIRREPGYWKARK
jgi:plasmid stabilization system protein ParE